MTVHDELHRLIERLDDGAARQHLHTLVNDLDDEQAHETLRRMQTVLHHVLERQGFCLS